MIKLEYLTIGLLSSIFGLSKDNFLLLCKRAPSFYKHRSIVNITSNKKRKFQIPNKALKYFQILLLEKILDFVAVHPKLFGRPKTSIKDAVNDHTQKEIVITIDIKNFFPSIPAFRIRRSLMNNGSSREVAIQLTRLLTHENKLPQGAPTSPCIGRIVLTPFAEEMGVLIENMSNSAFSIYVDDITISGNMGIQKVIPSIYSLLNKHGFKANLSKTKIMKRDEEQISLNIKLNNRIEATSSYLKEIEDLENIVPPSDLSLIGKKSFVEYLLR